MTTLARILATLTTILGVPLILCTSLLALIWALIYAIIRTF